MSGKTGGSGGPDGSSGEDVRLPYPETSALPDVGKIMKDLGIESTVPQGIPESSSPDVSVKPGGLGFESFFGRPGEVVGLPSCETSPDVSVKPGGLGFGSFFGRPSEFVGLPSCETSGEFPNVEKIMKDLSIESPVSGGIPENILASSDVSGPPVRTCGFGFKEEMLNKSQNPDKNKNLPDASPTASEKKTDMDDPTKNAEIGKPS